MALGQKEQQLAGTRTQLESLGRYKPDQPVEWHVGKIAADLGFAELGQEVRPA